MFVPAVQAEIAVNMFFWNWFEKKQGLENNCCMQLINHEHGDVLIFKQRSFVFLPLSFCVSALS